MENLKLMSMIFAAAMSMVLITACGDNSDSVPDETTKNTVAANLTGDSLSSGGCYTLVFNGHDYTVNDVSAVVVENNAIILTKGGTYTLSGALDNGQIRIRTEKDQQVNLILNGLTASCSTSAPLYIESADKTIVELASGTINTFTDGSSYIFPAADVDKPNACIYSADDLTIKGDGSLIVNGNYNNGIGCKNDLKIKSGEITVNAIRNALKGNDSVEVEDGTIVLTAAKDGIKSDGTDDGSGIVTISGGTITATCTDDGIQAKYQVAVTGGSITLICGSLPVNCGGTQNITEGCIITG